MARFHSDAGGRRGEVPLALYVPLHQQYLPQVTMLARREGPASVAAALAAAICLITAGWAGLGAQDAPSPLPAFEVASIRVNKTAQMNRLFRPQPGGRFEATNLRLRDLIQFAYRVRNFQIEGGPDWMDKVNFDIVAKAPADIAAAAVQEQLGLKLESSRGPVPMLVVDRAEMPVED
jgi:hypothetical protein